MARVQQKTPAECIGSIIRSAMSAREINAEQLAKLVGVHANTVYSDLHDPDRIQMWYLGETRQQAEDAIAQIAQDSISSMASAQGIPGLDVSDE